MEQEQYGGDFSRSTNYGSQMIDNRGNVTNIFHKQTEDPQVTLQKALYFKEMNDRARQILAAAPETFEWVWSTSFATWLGKADDGTFWICGKPGSGKSTLMKHLASTQKVLKYLPNKEADCIRIHFYFDFRAGAGIANTPLGMLKSFALQLFEALPRGKTKLENLTNRLPMESISYDDLAEVICRTIESSKKNVLAFIDGLDEYAGDLHELVQSLLILRDNSGLKMCLASRPERAFITAFESLPSFRMQDYNGASIKSYIETAISRRQHNFKTSFPRDLGPNMIQAARGVILWARFAIEELLEGCERGDSPDKLRETLKTLPPQVEEMYRLILDKLESGHRGEAAIILAFIIDSGGSISVKHLLAACIFTCNESIDMPQMKDMDESHFEGRILALFGSLLDVLPQHPKYLRLGNDVRTIHKTLQSYLANSDWLLQNLPVFFRNKFSRAPWLQTFASAIKAASREITVVKTEFIQNLQKNLLERSESKKYGIDEYVMMLGWRTWKDILHIALITFFELWNRHGYEDTTYHEIIQSALEDKVMLLHIFLRPPKWESPLEDFLSQWTRDEPIEYFHTNKMDFFDRGYYDLLIATAYGYSEYIKYRISTDHGAIEHCAQHLLDLALYFGTHRGRQDRLPKHLEIANIAISLGAVVYRPHVREVCSGHAFIKDMSRFIPSVRHLISASRQQCSDVPRLDTENMLFYWVHLRWELANNPLIDCSELLALFIEIGEPINGTYQHGGTILHEILDSAHSFPAYWVFVPWRLILFVVAIKSGANPEIEGPRGTVLSYAKTLHRRARIEWIKRPTRLDCKLDVKLAKTVVRFLDHYIKVGNWEPLEKCYSMMKRTDFSRECFDFFAEWKASEYAVQW